MRLNTPMLVTVAVLACFAAAIAYGAWRWEARSRALRARLEGAREPVVPEVVDLDALRDLPAPVQRYFRSALTQGQPLVAAASLQHAGTIDMGGTSARWKTFTSVQRVVTRRPGFVWDARVAMLPGLSARVHDAYVAGEGVLHASLFGLATLMDVRGTPELAHGELMRWFAESAWYPTALLPGQGVRWEAVDDSSARATLADGGTTVTLLFRFDASGLVASVRAEARGRAVDGTVVPTPWEGRFWGHETHDGMRVPMECEVAWVLPDGPRPYWRGHITGLRHEFTR